jgi:hypothetical protein
VASKRVANISYTSHFFEVLAAEGFKEWAAENSALVAEIHEAMTVKHGTKASNNNNNNDASSSSQPKTKKSSTQKRRRTSS